MPTGNRRMRAARRFALSLVIAISAGCGRQAIHRVDPSMLPPRDPSLIGSAAVPPPEPASPVEPAPAQADAAPAPTPAPTPTLDAGLMRAEALKRSIVEEVSQPAPTPAAPASAPEIAQVEPLAMPDMKALPDEAAPATGPNRDREIDHDSAPTRDAIPPGDPDLGRAGLVAGPPAADAKSAAKPEPGSKVVGNPAAPPTGDAPQDGAGAGGIGPVAQPIRELAANLIGPKWEGGAAPPAPEAGPEPSKPGAAEEPFGIAELTLCRRVFGFGSVEPWGASHVRPGQAIILYCEVAGLRYEPDGERFRSRLAATLELTPEGGDRPAWGEALGPAEDVCRRPRRDYFVSYRISLPATLPPGPYRLRLAQDDLIAGRSTARTIPLVVGP